MSEPFFILPDAKAADARDEIYISIDGTVRTLSAATVVKMIAELQQLTEYLDAESREMGCDAGNFDGGNPWNCGHCQAIEWMNRIDATLDPLVQP
jgi:hypothetical protein